jgi:penicillin-binding protein 2
MATLSSRPTRRTREERLWLLTGTVLAGFVLVVAGLVRLQVAQHDKFLALSEENHVRLEVLRAPRGTLFDRNGVLLADSAPSFSIVFRPFPAESAQRARSLWTPAWFAKVTGLLGADSSLVRHAVDHANASGQSAILRTHAPFEMRAAFEELREELPGIEVQIEPVRRYPHGELAAHFLGYAGEINERELDTLATKGYRMGDLIGRTGVERSLEDLLRGDDGAEFVVVNAIGRRVSTLGDLPPRLPTPGRDVVLTMDLKVQRAMEEVMADVEKGACVAIDTRDGGILGLVSRPAFDPNEFSLGLTRQRWHELSSGGVLLNRAIQGRYPPGSTFKIVTMLSALNAKVAHPGTRLAPCPGRYFFGGRWFGCWKKTGHGSLDFIEALEHSCDVYFYQIGPKLGLPALEKTARQFGLGSRTGVDLPQEVRGLVPSQAYYEKMGRGRLKGTMLNLAIGQGELLVTPIQLALMLAETGNGGRGLRPHVVREVRGTEYQSPPPGHARIEASPEDWRAVQEALERVVATGTGTAARVPGVRVAGKTGTAQNPHGQDHALFACYAPADDPRIALAFVIENAGHGGSEAAPRAGRVLRSIFLPDSLNPDLRRQTLPVRVAAHPSTPDEQALHAAD